jgi:hypothetical protein
MLVLKDLFINYPYNIRDAGNKDSKRIGWCK